METEALRAKHANVWQSAPKVMTILPAFKRYWIKLILDTAPRVLLRMRSSCAETAIHAKLLATRPPTGSTGRPCERCQR
jgi:hypothetical protein